MGAAAGRLDSLGLAEFGARLLRSNDLDPVYVALWDSGLEWDLTRKVLMAYWCFYHLGTASWVSEPAPGGASPEESEYHYWERFRMAAESKAYPRCHERRHFRGEAALRSVAFLRSRGLDQLFDPFGQAAMEQEAGNARPMPAKKAMAVVEQWRGFGPWIAFKAADMLERLGIVAIDFDAAAVTLFDSPQEGAELAWERYGSGPRPANVAEWAIGHILSHFPAPERNDLESPWTNARASEDRGPPAPKDVLAPPRYERGLNAQEAETILCKWKSYLKGHYTIGEDVAALRSGLAQFARCPVAQRLLAGGKAGGLW